MSIERPIAIPEDAAPASVARTEIERDRLGEEALEDVLSKRPEIAEAMSKMLAHRGVEL